MSKHNPDPAIQWPALSDVMLHKAYRRAQALKITFSDYVKRLIVQDTKTVQNDPWIPVPQHVLDRWAREIKQFEEEDRKNPRPAALSAAEFMRELDREAETLPDHETD